MALFFIFHHQIFEVPLFYHYFSLTGMFKDEDLLAPAKRKLSSGRQKDASQFLANMSELSARERAAAMRKAKSQKREASAATSSFAPAKKQKQEAADGSDAGVTSSTAPAIDDSQQWQEALDGRWPFQRICDHLCLDLLHAKWEVRHGAALGLREILRTHASAAGVIAPVAADPGGYSLPSGAGPLTLGVAMTADAVAAREANLGWLEDCAVHLLCVLALDRFGDFVSDQVVAPVRETAAQALGLVARPLPAGSTRNAIAALSRLASCDEWEVRHGGLLGLKYVMAAKETLEPELLGAVLPAAVIGLQDKDDDVQAVAADALFPAAHLLAADDSPASRQVKNLLWEALLKLQDLSPATGSVMSLLGRIYAEDNGNAAAEAELLAMMVPRLWPFMRHNLSSVREAVLECLSSLLKCRPAAEILPGQELKRAAMLLFMNLIFEQQIAIVRQTHEVWSLLIERASPHDLSRELESALSEMITLASTLPRHRFDSKLLIVADTRADAQPATESLVLEADGDTGRTMGMRTAAALALGQLAYVLCKHGVQTSLPQLIQRGLGGASAAGKLVGAFITIYWAQAADEEPAGILAELQMVLGTVFEQLGLQSGARYAELEELYRRLPVQAQAVCRLAEDAGVLTTSSLSLDAVTSETAAVLAKQILESTCSDGETGGDFDVVAQNCCADSIPILDCLILISFVVFVLQRKSSRWPATL
jgi:TATA-binding protein-associated factor